MKTLLYIGNKLATKGQTKTSIETLGEFLAQEGYKLITASSKSNKILRLLDMIWHIYKLRNTIDYLLIDTYSTSNFYYAYCSAFLAQKFKIKYIPILHGGNLPARLKISPKKSKAIFENACLNIAPSRYLLEAFLDAGYTNLRYIPNTIKIENYPFKERTILQPKLLWVRSFASIYNPLLALKVLKKLQETYPNAELCMVGPDKDDSLKACEAYAHKYQLNVTFTGKLTKQAWIELSTEYDIFINTTTVDNTPVSVIEAMALGLPIVSTNVGGISYLIDSEKDGLLVPSNNKEDMVNALVKILNNNVLSTQLTKNARLKVESFDWEVVKHQWLEVLS